MEGNAMIRNLARATMMTMMMLAFAGCEDSSSNSSPNDPTGTWSFNVRSTDDYVAFNNTSLVIAVDTNTPGVYSVTWSSPVPNGTATFDTNTFTVVMNITQSPTVLSLSGTLVSDSMSGGGTISGYGGLRVASWQASR
jgi:hypothetical protein